MQRAIQTLSILDDSSSTLTLCSTLMTNQHVFRANQHDVSPETPDFEKIQTLLWLGQCGYCSENHGIVYPMGSLHTQYIPYEETFII